jgi:hypothetical protein
VSDRVSANRAAVEAAYEARRAERQAGLAALDRRHAAFGAVRLAVAAGFIALVVLTGLRHPGLIAGALAAFAAIAVGHARLLSQRSRVQSAITFYERGLLRIRHQWIGTGRGGDEYKPADHLYADDLNLFGRGSLFELLATMRTKAGDETLARWMTSPADAALARSRQTAVRELAGRADLREQIATTGDDVRAAVDAPILRRWAAAPVQIAGRSLRAGLFALAAVTSGLVVNWLATGRLSTATLAVVLLQAVVAWRLKPKVSRVIQSVEEPSHDLDVLAALLSSLEREQFSSPHLITLAGRLRRDALASQEIAALSRRVAMLSARKNAIFALPAAFMLWGSQWAASIEAWRARAGADIPLWLDVIGEFETLVALASYAAEHPDNQYPDIVDDPARFEAKDLRHPALNDTAVGNDLALNRTALMLIVVSGSNMSGKSTWLRTIGTNVVLALLGAPVRASSCRMSSLAIGAAIQVPDSLTEGKSRFYAEITRLKAIVDLARTEQGRVLFLLDEILSGTNSHDRQVGAEALIRGLIDSGAIGLVTTHDLAIGEIAESVGARATNAHFADEFVNGALLFDYRMMPGVVRTRNALALMRSIGLDV